MSCSTPALTQRASDRTTTDASTPSAAASSACEEVTSRTVAAGAVRLQPTSPMRVTGMSPAGTVRVTVSSGCGASPATTAAVPSVGCPANGISWPGVKMRTVARPQPSWPVMKEVSLRLNCRAHACICASESAPASVMTASGIAREGVTGQGEDVEEAKRQVHVLSVPEPTP